MRLPRRPQHERTPFLAEIFLISAAALVLEISYTRIISFKLYYYYTYLVIGLALLGLGSGAVVVAISARLKAMSTRRLLLGCSVAGAVGVIVGYVVVAVMPLDTILLWEGSAGRAAEDDAAAARDLPRRCTSASCRSAWSSRRCSPAGPQDINRLYFADLAGAALACIARRAGDRLDRSGRGGRCRGGDPGRRRGHAVSDRRRPQPADRRARRRACCSPSSSCDRRSPRRSAPSRARDSDRTRRRRRAAGAPCSGSTRWSSRTSARARRRSSTTTGSGGPAIWKWDGDPRSLTRFDDDDRSVPFAALGAAAGAGADHRCGRRQRDPGRVHFDADADRRGGAEPGDGVAAARRVRRLRRQRHRPTRASTTSSATAAATSPSGTRSTT